MLILSRKLGEKIKIGDSIEVTVSRISGNRVTLGISAPDHVHIVRAEIEPIVNAFREPRSQPAAHAALVDSDGPMVCAAPSVS
jgi:carbon storage regulator CsrA